MPFLTGPSQRPLLESMEARILHSVDIAPLLLESTVANAYALPDATGSLTEASVQRSEIVFIDASVPEVDTLLADWQMQREVGRLIEVIIIGSNQDGLDLIGFTLAGRHDVAAVHVLAHGADGVMQLGNTRLDAQTLLARADLIAAWGNVLTADADLLFYGCDFAQTSLGQQLVRDLALLTGADVAASANLTGAALSGGDWALEYNAGIIEARVVLSTEGQAQWNGMLATYNVTAGVADGAVGSLRWAITQANANSNDDIINIAAGTYNLTITGGDDANAKGDLDIRENVTLIGAGAGLTIIDASAAGSRVFDVIRGTVVIQGVTITGGSDTGADGGGVFVESSASLTLIDVVIQGNRGRDGAGIFNEGTLTLNQVKLNNNIASREGGALHNATSATLTDVWIDNNAAKWGGGVFADGAWLSMTRVTVSNNSASQDGGGLFLEFGALEGAAISNVTISGNSAGISNGKGGGIYLNSSSGLSATFVSNATITNNSATGGGGGIFTQSSNKVYLTNTILSANYVGANSNATQGSGGYNIDTDGTALPGALRPSAAAVKLGALVDNGGFSPTHALLAGSVAINAGNPSAPATDQRGFSRVGTPDIGAYESQVAPNTAPILNGSNNLTSILEDALSNSGTLVSALLAGHVSDADGTSVSGMAITAVNNTNGTWQFSVNGGSNWTSFVSLSNSTARLLAANALTSVRFVPNANWNGTVVGGLTFRAWDQSSGSAGGTADTSSNGGSSAFSTATGSASITVTSANDAPTGANRIVNAVEDTPYVFSVGDFGFSDPNDVPANTLAFVKISSLPSAGALTLSGVAVSLGDSISAAQINAGNLKYAPAANGNGAGYASFTFQVQDNGGTANGGVDMDPTARTLTVDVSAVNDAPVVSAPPAQDIASDTTRVFSTVNGNRIYVSDLDAGLSSIQMTLTTTNGSLTLNGVDGLVFSVGDGAGNVTMTFTGSVASINTALDGLQFTPSVGFVGGVNVTIHVDDLGNSGAPGAKTGSGGVIVNVSFVNTAPSLGAGPYALSDTFEDASSDPGTSVLALLAGRANDVNNSAQLGIAVSAVDNNNGTWQYSLDSGANWLNFYSPSPGVSRLLAADSVTFVRFQGNLNWSGTVANGLTFRAWDQTSGAAGGTADASASGGATAFSAELENASVLVKAVNDAPVGTEGRITVLEHGSRAFTAADFGFSDPGDAGTHAFSSVQILSLPGLGTLTLSGTAVLAGDFVSASSLSQLVFSPSGHDNGTDYTSFTFKVRDDGGVLDGGVDLELVARTMFIDVLSVNDAPTGVDHAITLLEDGSYTFTATDFGFSDPSDIVPNRFQSVTITSLPVAGHLTLAGAVATVGLSVPVGNIHQLVFTPWADGNGATYASFTFKVQDDGGLVNGGVDLDVVARTMTVSVLPVNDAPTATDGRVSTPEGVSYVFKLADFGFGDLLDSPAHALRNVVIGGLPGLGELKLAGGVVAVGQYISRTEIVAGELVFAPGGGGNGVGYANFSFKVQDDGETADGGVDLALTSRTLTIDVTAAIAPSSLVIVLDDSPVPSPPIAAVVQPAEPSAPASVRLPASSVAPEVALAPLLNAATLSIEGVQGFSVNVEAFPVSRGASSGYIASPVELTTTADSVLAAVVFSEFTGITLSSISQALQNTDLLKQLEDMRTQLQAFGDRRHDLIASSIAVSGGLSIGYVIWLVRGGVLVSSMLSALPAWQLIDPLPVLATAAGKKRKAASNEGDDQEFERLFDEAEPVKAVLPPSDETITTKANSSEVKA